jgi:hypothetical protein
MQVNHQVGHIITRRNFLKMSALGAIAALVPSLPASHQKIFPGQLTIQRLTAQI